MAVDNGGGTNSALKNLGNVVGLYKGPNPPKESDGVTEKRYVLWSKEYATLPKTYEIHYFDFFVGRWLPLYGIQQIDFDYLKFMLFGSLDYPNLQVEINSPNILQAIKILREQMENMDGYVTTHEFNTTIAELVNGALADYDSFGEVQQALLDLLAADAGFFTVAAQTAYALTVANQFLTKVTLPAAEFRNSNYILSGAGSPLLISTIMQNIYSNNGTLTGNREIDLASFSLAFKNLQDKSADASFNKLMALDSQGRIGSTNGATLLKSMPSLFTDAEKNTWKTLMNGGWSTGTMSVAIVSPPVVDQTDRPFWINLKGANLNLPPVSFKIELCTGASNDAATATVVAEIPNSQVQLYTNGTDLTFYYNFSTIPLGTYKLRLWNGVAYYLTSFTLQVVAEIERIDLDNIVWDSVIYGGATSSLITQSGSTVSYNSDAAVKAFADDSEFIAGRKTNTLVNADEDFYMTVEISGYTGFMDFNGSMAHFVGLVNSASSVSLLNQTLVNIKLLLLHRYPNTVIHADNASETLLSASPSYALTAIFMRRGSSWTVVVNYNNQTILYTKTGYTGAVSFGMYNQNTIIATNVTANIVELYKF